VLRWVWVLPFLANKHTSSQTHASQWHLNNISTPSPPHRSSLQSSYWVMMDTVFESHAQYLYLTDMRYYAYIKGWFTKGVGHWKKSPVKFSWYKATKGMGGAERTKLYAVTITNFIGVTLGLNNLQTPWEFLFFSRRSQILLEFNFVLWKLMISSR
jgi:hypothetical protein